MADRTVAVQLTLDVNPYTRGAREASRATASIADAGDRASNRMGQAMSSMARTAGQVTAASLTAGTALMTSAMRTGVAYNTLEQTARGAFTTLLGGAAEANAMMEEIREFGRSSPFPRQLWIQASQQLVGFGLEAEKVVDTLAAVQDAAAASGQGTRAIEPIVDVLARLNSQGRLGGQALERLGYYGLDAAAIIGEQMGKTGDQIKDMASRPGGIPVEQIWDPLITGLTENFGGAAENIRFTWFGAVDRIAGAWRDLGSEIAQPFVTREGGGLAVGWANQFAELLRDIEEKTPAVVEILTGRLEPAFDAFSGGLDRARAAVGAFDVRTLNDSLDQLSQYAPLIAGVGTALVALGVQSIPVLRNIPILGTNPLLAGILALVAASPELRGVAVDFIQALGPILPVAQDLAMQLADVAMEVLGNLAPALDSLAQALAPVIVTLTHAFAPALSGLMSLAAPAASIIGGLAEAIAAVPTPVLTAVAAFVAFRALNLVGMFTPAAAAVRGFTDQVAMTREFAAQWGVQVGTMGAAAATAGTRISGLGVAMRTAFLSNPIGLAIAGVATAFGVFATQAAEARARSDELRASLDQTTGSATEASAAVIAEILDEEITNNPIFRGQTYLQVAEDFGIATSTMIDAIQGVGSAQAEVNRIFAELEATDTDQTQANAVHVLRTIMGELSEDFDENSASIQRQAEATRDVAGASDDAAAAIRGLASAQREVTDNTLSAREAQRRWYDTLDRVKAQIEDGTRVTRDASGAIVEWAEGSRDAEAALDGMVRQAYSTATAMAHTGASFEEVEDSALSQRIAFLQVAQGLGYTAEEAKGLADELYLIPDVVAAAVEAEGFEEAIAASDDLQNSLEDLDGTSADVAANETGNALSRLQSISSLMSSIREQGSLRLGLMAYGSQVPGRAFGGAIYGPGSETSDSIMLRASHNEHMWSAAEVRGAGGHGVMEQMRAAARSGDLARYANGGAVTAAYQSAAFGAGVASSGSSRPAALHASIDMRGMRFAFEPDGFLRAVEGVVDVAIGAQQRHDNSRSSAVYGGR